MRDVPRKCSGPVTVLDAASVAIRMNGRQPGETGLDFTAHQIHRRRVKQLVLTDLPLDVQAAVQCYLAAAATFTPGAESTMRVELPQLAIAETLLRALGLPTLADLFDQAHRAESPRVPVVARLLPRKGARRA